MIRRIAQDWLLESKKKKKKKKNIFDYNSLRGGLTV